MKVRQILILVLLAIAGVAGWRLHVLAAKHTAEHAAVPVSAQNSLIKAGPDPVELGMAQVFLSRGAASFERGEYVAAVAHFGDAIVADPGNAKAYFLRANAYWQLQQLSLAIADLSSAIEVGGQPFYYYSRCGAYFFVGDWDAAISDCSDTVRLAPMEADAYFLRASARYAKGDLDGALADSLTVLMIRKKDPNASRLLDEVLAEREMLAHGGRRTAAPSKQSHDLTLTTAVDAGR